MWWLKVLEKAYGNEIQNTDEKFNLWNMRKEGVTEVVHNIS